MFQRSQMRNALTDFAFYFSETASKVCSPGWPSVSERGRKSFRVFETKVFLMTGNFITLSRD